MDNILITGGMGFIGSHFVRLAVKGLPNATVYNLDKLTYAGNPRNLDDIRDARNYVELTPHTTGGSSCDIADASLMRFIMTKFRIDTVINFAAESHVDRSILDAAPFVKTNVLGTMSLIEASRQAGVRRFVQISTDEVYGSVDEGFSRETDPMHPNSPYAASKLASEQIALSYFRTHKFPVLVTRSSNNYGPFHYPEKVIPLFITNLLEGKKVPLYGDGLNVRDWIHVEDNAHAIMIVLQNGIEGEVYNIAGQNHFTNKELTLKIIKAMGKDESSIQKVEDRKGHDRRYALDDSKIRNALGWNPKIRFEDGLNKTIAWYKDRADWWKPLKERM